MGTELAKAYVQIIPTAEGLQGKLSSLMGSEAESAGKSAGGKFSSFFGSAAKAGLAAVGAGIAAASAAVVKVAKDAVAGFADYEQLTGGIETLFGTGGKGIEEYARELGLPIEKAVEGYRDLVDVQELMMSNADNAFRTAGLSANEYMEMAIQSGASMISSLDGDTKRAAELMDLAIVDMSDNVNKMGSSMESVQNAYRGFAKGNFTMLDNLALGYGGTKEEMERLLADAQELAGVEFDISSYADIVQAIHVVQDSMGITGTTAKEASETISGSLASMKSAWSNLLVGMADPAADLSGLIGNLVDSAETAFGNILPVAEQALGGIASFVEQIAPIIAEKLPGLVDAVLPSVLNAATSLVTALVAALPSILQVLIEQGPVIINQLLATILEMLPEIIGLGLTLIVTLANGIVEALPELVPALVDTVLEIVDVLTDPENLGMLIDASVAIIVALANGLIASLPKIIERLPEIIENIVSGLGKGVASLGEVAVELMVALAEGLIKGIPQLVLKIPEIIMGIVGGLLDGAKDLISSGAKINEFIAEGFFGTLDNVAQWGKDLIGNFIGGIKQGWEDLKTGVKNVAQGVKDFLGFSEPKEGPLSDFHTYAPDMMALFAQGIRDNEHLITEQLEKSLDFGARVLDVNAKVTGGASPVRASEDAAGTGISAATLAEAITLALQGCGVYMDGQTVGRLVTRAQTRATRANGI